MKNKLLIVLLSSLVISCGNSSSDDVFPVKYQVCDISSDN